MAQNIYDSPDFFAGYSKLLRQVHGLEGAPEWPAIRAMLPSLDGKRVVDLGCGFGWASRWMREQGAASVLGVDLSQSMIERARADTTDAAIKYRIADLETLDLPESAFDLAYSSLAFHYVQNFGRLVHVIRKALVPDGHSSLRLNIRSSWQPHIRTGLVMRRAAKLGRSIDIPLRVNVGRTGSPRAS
ncbi:SAM-dependent methyltransferase [Bradyrhizobium sp. CIR48]|nr:SAM-dependent methyltransferase [Bradyrhizobium sp. CIR48]